jgi:hypothetical protein
MEIRDERPALLRAYHNRKAQMAVVCRWYSVGGKGESRILEEVSRARSGMRVVSMALVSGVRGAGWLGRGRADARDDNQRSPARAGASRLCGA